MPTLARLSFFPPPAHLDDFAVLYDRHLTPLLQPHGLEAGSHDSRPPVAGVFSRLFAVDSPTALQRTTQALRHDPTWKTALQDLEARLGESLRYHLGIYVTPAGPGTVVDAGPGRRQQQWHSFGVAHGLASPLVGALLWGREGKLWIGTWDGLTSFDGAQFVNYTVADGLPGRVRFLCQDHQGRLWIGTGGFLDGLGWVVCCFDRKEFVTCTTADGLAGNWAGSLHQDRQGAVCLGTQAGLCRFDGERSQSFGTADGLTADWVWAIEEAAQGGSWIGTEKGLCRLEGERFVTVDQGEGLGHAPGRVIVEDSRGRLWFATDGGGASCWAMIASIVWWSMGKFWLLLDPRFAGVSIQPGSTIASWAIFLPLPIQPLRVEILRRQPTPVRAA